jgi:nodulation protein E
MPSAAASQVSMQLSIAGPVFTVSSACSSANHAIAQAALLIRAGVVEVAIAGGTDAPFTYGLLKAWEALRVVSTDNCRPFSADRSGLVLGEGAGMVVLESERHARRRGAPILARLAGSGMTADAGHITDPSADGAARAIRAALRDAAIDAQAVDYVNAHGTGTLANDRTETEALHRVFGAHAKALVVSSTKAMHGHALGASGGLEFIATVLALRDGIIPPTINFTGPGEGCDLDYVPNVAREKPIRVAISNSFAFGGLNAVQVLQAI